MVTRLFRLLFFFNDTATTEIYTLSLHDALPIFGNAKTAGFDTDVGMKGNQYNIMLSVFFIRSEEHMSELQSPDHLVCRLLLEKKKKKSRSHGRNKIRRPRTANMSASVAHTIST